MTFTCPRSLEHNSTPMTTSFPSRKSQMSLYCLSVPESIHHGVIFQLGFICWCHSHCTIHFMTSCPSVKIRHSYNEKKTYKNCYWWEYTMSLFSNEIWCNQCWYFHFEHVRARTELQLKWVMMPITIGFIVFIVLCLSILSFTCISFSYIYRVCHRGPEGLHPKSQQWSGTMQRPRPSSNFFIARQIVLGAPASKGPHLLLRWNTSRHIGALQCADCFHSQNRHTVLSQSDSWDPRNLGIPCHMIYTGHNIVQQ